MMEKKRKNFILLVMIMFSFSLCLSFLFQSFSPSSVIRPEKTTLGSKIATCETGNATHVFTENDGTQLSYLGSTSYGDERNVQIDENGLSSSTAYLKIKAKTWSKSNTTFVYSFNDKYTSLDNLTILIQERVYDGWYPLNVFMKNITSENFVDLSFSLDTSTSYTNHQKTMYNASDFNLMNFYDDVNNEITLRLHCDSTSYSKSWLIDYTYILLCGNKDTTPPQIDSFTRNVSSPSSNDAITFNATITDDETDINTVIFQFEGDVGLGDNLTYNITDLVVNGNDYSYITKLLSGDWTVTVFVSDDSNNWNQSSMCFSVSTTVDTQTFLSSNVTSTLRSQPVGFKIYVQGGSSNTEDVWLHDAFLSSNQTIESDVNNQTTLVYDYVSSSSSLGTYYFTSYVNTSAGKTTSFTILEPITILADDTIPQVIINDVNDTYLGIGHGSQVNFSVYTSNDDFNLDDAWIYNPMTMQNVSIATEIGDKSLHTYLFNVSSITEGTYYFIIYVNDSNNNEQHVSIAITWTILTVKPVINVYVDKMTVVRGQEIEFFVTVEGTEYDLDDVFYFDGNLAQLVSITTDINNKTRQTYSFKLIESTETVLQLTFYVNDTYNNTQSITFTVFWVTPPPAPPTISDGLLFGFVAGVLGVNVVTGLVAIVAFRRRQAKRKAIEEVGTKKKKGFPRIKKIS